MSWWGKIAGGTFGFVIGGPIGALIFGALGHNLDVGMERLEKDEQAGSWNKERTQTAFFTATFSVMGHIAKADGKVTQDEIQMANMLMDHMDLNEQQRTAARELFTKGKAEDFPLEDILEQFRKECFRHRELIQMFIEMQLFAAYADGNVHPKERHILQKICHKLGFSSHAFQQLEARIRAQHGFSGEGSARHATNGLSIEEAYSVLGVKSSASDKDVKRAYRKLMSEHHPDKLVAKGLPEEMMKVATEKTKEIQGAYDLIKKSRK